MINLLIKYRSFSKAIIRNPLLNNQKNLISEKVLNLNNNFFDNRSTLSLIRTMMILKICSTKCIVDNSKKMYYTTKKIIGPTLTSFAIKNTIFPEFIGGENEKEVFKAIDNLNKYKIKTILDYALEVEDVKDDEKFEIISESAVKKFFESIKICSSQPDGIIALKMTALVNPKLLRKISTIIHLQDAFLRHDTKKGFESFRLKALKMAAIPNIDLKSAFENLKILNKKNRIEKFDFIDFGKKLILNTLDLTQKTPFSPEKESKLTQKTPFFTEKDVKLTQNAISKLFKIAAEAESKNVKLMVDAEQSYFHPAIDYFVLEAQSRFNKKQTVILTTVQSYLKKAKENMAEMMEIAERRKFVFSCKVVCGAYMNQERQLAAELNYDDPINEDKIATMNSYRNCVDFYLNKMNKNGHLMAATHNSELTEFAVKKGNSLNKNSAQLSFAQLFGMSDKITFSLASEGYRAYKYLPFGKVDEVVPYLLRRMEENQSIKPRILKEYLTIKKEIKKRIFCKGC